MTDADGQLDAPRRPSLSVVVPCYRSPSTLAELPAALREATADLVSSLEVVLVDDGSPDDTWRRVRALAASDPDVRAVRLLRNYGQHNAIAAGLQQASGELVLTMDDDLQTPPDQVPLLFGALTDDVDLVYAYPEREPQTLARNVASRLTKRTMALGLGRDVNHRASQFRLFRRELLPVFASLQDPFVSIDVALSWATGRVDAVPVRFDVRREGRSGYTFRRLVRHALNMLTGYSTMPLRVVSMIGMVAALIGFVLLGFVVARWAFGEAGVPGFSFLASAITLFSGVQLLCMGVLGEYLGRIHFRSMGRPPFMVREVVTRAAPTSPKETS